MWVWLCLGVLSHVNGAAAGIRVRARDAPPQEPEDYRHLHGGDLPAFVRLGFIWILSWKRNEGPSGWRGVT